MKYFPIIILFSVFFICTGCKEEAKIHPKEYPYVFTKDVIDIDSTGATLIAEITNLGQSKIIKHGFVWSKKPNPTIGNNSKLYENGANKGLYSYKINSGLVNEQTYYVRAYIKTKKYHIYGNEVSFKSSGSLYFPWLRKKNFSSAGSNSASFAIQDKGYIINAKSTNMFEYNPVSDTWKDNINLPENSGSLPLAISVNGKAYVLLNNNFWEYTIDGTWQLKAKFSGRLGYERVSVFIMEVDSSIGIGYLDYNQYFWNYDIENDIWIKKENFPGSSGRLIAGNFTFSLFGKSYLGINNDYKNQLWEYNPTNEIWKQISNFPIDSYQLWAHFVINNELFLGLGKNRNYHNEYVSNAMWKYNSLSETWYRYNDCPERMVVNASFTINNKGYIVSANGVWEFDPSKN